MKNRPKSQQKQLDRFVQREEPGSYELIVTEPETLASIKRRHVLGTLAWAKGNITIVAAALGVDRRSIYRQLDAYGVSRSKNRANDLGKESRS
jgi:transcriptional regulator of acetoin/glycerol metabolism